jgi:hypothetical protein
MLKSYIDRIIKEAQLEEDLTEETKNCWSFFLSPSLNFMIQEENESIIFTCELGQAPKSAKSLEELLYANFGFSGTFGSTIALDKSLDKAVIWRSILSHAGYECFRGNLEDFANCAEYWSGFVRGEKTNTL